MLADIAQPGGAQEGVGDGVADDVGIRVADQAPGMVDPHSAQQERPPLGQAMCVVPDSDPHLGTPSRILVSGFSLARRLSFIQRGS